jgi:hypothetical protein
MSVVMLPAVSAPLMSALPDASRLIFVVAP